MNPKKVLSFWWVKTDIKQRILYLLMQRKDKVTLDKIELYFHHLFPPKA